MYSSALSQVPVQLERVAANQIYHIDKAGNRRLICASNNTPSGNVCLRSAGYRTSHWGHGFCWLHDTQASRNAWDIMLNNNNPANQRLAPFLTNATSLTEEHLGSVDSDLYMLYAIAASIQNTDMFTNSDAEQLRKVIADIGKLKETRSKLAKEVKFDMVAIKSFIDAVFGVIVSQTDSVQARRIITAVMEKIILPLESTGRLDSKPGDVSKMMEEHNALIERKPRGPKQAPY